jgi:hypothetical protein
LLIFTTSLVVLIQPRRRPALASERRAEALCPDVRLGMGQLAPEVLGRQIGRQAELGAVKEPVVGAAEPDHTIGMRAPSEPLRHQVRRIDRCPAADDAPAPGDLVSLPF